MKIILELKNNYEGAKSLNNRGISNEILFNRLKIIYERNEREILDYYLSELGFEKDKDGFLWACSHITDRNLCPQHQFIRRSVNHWRGIQFYTNEYARILGSSENFNTRINYRVFLFNKEIAKRGFFLSDGFANKTNVQIIMWAYVFFLTFIQAMYVEKKHNPSLGYIDVGIGEKWYEWLEDHAHLASVFDIPFNNFMSAPAFRYSYNYENLITYNGRASKIKLTIPSINSKEEMGEANFYGEYNSIEPDPHRRNNDDDNDEDDEDNDDYDNDSDDLEE
jgi:hypothetical protein